MATGKVRVLEFEGEIGPPAFKDRVYHALLGALRWFDRWRLACTRAGPLFALSQPAPDQVELFLTGSGLTETYTLSRDSARRMGTLLLELTEPSEK